MSADEQGQAVAGKRRGRIRTRWLVVGIVVVVLAAYLGVVALYASSGRGPAFGDASDVPDGTVEVVFTTQAVLGATERLTMDMRINPAEDLMDADGITMAENVSVIVTPVDGKQLFDLPKGSTPFTVSVPIVASGAVETWPFDRYQAAVAVVAYKTVDGVRHGLPVRIAMGGNVSGWNFNAVAEKSPELGETTTQAGEKVPVTVVSVEAYRSGSTLAFGFLLLGLLVVMPTLVLIVAILAFTGKRKVEATLMSWMGAMLFATIPLRTFLPGSPPIGSWIDFLVVLWVIVALVTGLGIYVAAWVRWNGPATKPPRPPASES